MKPLYFLHGLEGSPQGTKARFLKRHYPHLVCPPLSPDLEQRLAVLHSIVRQPAVLIGSSLGGLSALAFAMEAPELVLGMVLVAPAVGYFEPDRLSAEQRDLLARLQVPPGIPTRILAAAHDHLIPPQAIKDLLARSPQPDAVGLTFYDDDHSMNQHLDQLAQALGQVLEELE